MTTITAPRPYESTPPKPDTPAYLVWSQTFNPGDNEENERLDIVGALVHNAFAVPSTKMQVYQEMKRWLDALVWDKPPVYYILCYASVQKYSTPELEAYWQEHPQQEFRFELMQGLYEEISHTTAMSDMAARKMGITRKSPLDDFLKVWGEKHNMPELMLAKSILDTFYEKPEDEDDRESCGQYAVAIFQALDQVYENSGRQPLELALPAGLNDSPA